MNIAGHNLYRVLFRIEGIKDQDFSKLVVAFSEKEAVAYIGDGAMKVTLVETDISMVIPDQYLVTRSIGGRL